MNAGVNPANYIRLKSYVTTNVGWLTVRSVLNNSVEEIALGVCISMGLSKTAVFIIISDLASLSYNIPNLLSQCLLALFDPGPNRLLVCFDSLVRPRRASGSGAMSIGAKYKGQKKYGRARALISCECIIAFCFSALFVMQGAAYDVGEGSAVFGSYASESEREAMVEASARRVLALPHRKASRVRLRDRRSRTTYGICV